jgi:transcription antitermination factor NusG
VLDLRTSKWFAVYTQPRNEKKVFERLSISGVETFLPLQKKLKKWSDRKKVVEEPLIRSYIFVRISELDYYTVLNTTGVIRYVSFEGKAVPIPDRQIDLLKKFLEENYTVEAIEAKFEPGELVEIRMGSMMGVTGEVVEHNGAKKIIIRIDHISHSLLVTLPKEYIIKF